MMFRTFRHAPAMVLVIFQIISFPAFAQLPSAGPSSTSALGLVAALTIYEAQKQAFLTVNAEEFQNLDEQYFTDVDLYSCGYPSNLDVSAGNPALPLIALDAANIYYWLTRAKYPDEVWKQALAAYEDLMIKKSISLSAVHGKGPWPDKVLEEFQVRTNGFADKLANKIRSAKLKGLPPVINSAGCGDGEEVYKILSYPQGGALKLITRWNKLVCDGRHIDAFNSEKCPGWISLSVPTSMPLAGSYHYQMSWPDGRHIDGQIDMNNPDLDDIILITPRGVAFAPAKH